VSSNLNSIASSSSLPIWECAEDFKDSCYRQNAATDKVNLVEIAG